MKSVKWLPIAIIAFAAPAIAQHDAFAGEWLQEHLPYESDAGKTKLFVNVDETARTGASARARLLLVDENPVVLGHGRARDRGHIRRVEDQLVEAQLDADSPVIGKEMREVDLPEGSTVVVFVV